MEIEEYIKFFADSQNKGIDDSVGENSIVEKEKELIEKAVGAAYSDIQRTCKGIGKCKEKKDKALKEICKKFCAFFDGDAPKKEKTFDQFWFDKNKPNNNPWLSIMTGTGFDTVGRAQKIVNMTFKYLYCVEGMRNKYKAHFKYCHMPLDSYTMAWIDDKDILPDSSTKWSALNYEDYYKFQNNAKEKIKELEGLTLLEAEFIIWPLAQIRKMNKEIGKFMSEYQKFPGFKEENKYIKKYINDYTSHITQV